MHLSNMAICLMDSDKAIGGLYLDADDLLHTGFLCQCITLGERGRDCPLSLQTDSQSLSLIVSVCLYTGLTDYTSSQHPLVCTVSPSLCINFPLMVQRGNKASLCR